MFRGASCGRFGAAESMVEVRPMRFKNEYDGAALFGEGVKVEMRRRPGVRGL